MAKRRYPGESEFKVFLRRDGERLKNVEGSDNISDFVAGIMIKESIHQTCMECVLVIEDSAGLIGALTGTEEVEIFVKTPLGDRQFKFRSIGITNRMKGTNTDSYTLKCMSEEGIRNESLNVFGHSNVLFGDTEGSEIVKTLLKDKKFLGSNKRFYSEKTLNTHSFISPNFRPLDVLYMVAQRSIRKPKAGGMLQNGFTFFENALGFHFKSYDKMIEDVSRQAEITETDFIKGLARMYLYDMSDPAINESKDQFRLKGVGFTEETNYMKPLRNGTYSGYSIGFDPVSLPSSQIGLSEDMPTSTYRYSLRDIWNSMEHLDGRTSVNPYSQVDKTIKEYVNSSRRIRYNILPNRVFDEKTGQPQATYNELSQLEAYEFLRIQSLKNVKVSVEMPGNIDLYAGTGIDIHVPANYNEAVKEVDRRYSGRYLITTVIHSFSPTTMSTSLEICKDSTRRALGQISS